MNRVHPLIWQTGAGMSATLKDVAELAGVSTATVSYVVNNGPRPVSGETRARVWQAVNQLGYQLRRKQRESASGKSLTVGVIVPNANATFFGEALEGIETFLYARGHNCLVGSSRSDPDIEKRLIRRLARLVDGLIITPTADVHAEIARLPERGIPTVIMDRQVSATRLSGVGIDNYNITTQAVRLLFDTGYERIALLNGPRVIDPVCARLEGYQEALAAVGLAYNPEYVLHVPFTAEAGRNAVFDLMSLPYPPEAIICTSTDLTVGALQSLKQLGLCVPEHMALVCYGDTVWTSLLSPAMTVVDAPAYLMGETSARLLLNFFSDPPKTETRHILLDTRLILRDTHRRQRVVGYNKNGNVKRET
jgi:LacI family transcriptional regulator